MRPLASALCLFAVGLCAQQAPYDVFPPANPPYYRTRYEAFQTGQLAFPVNYTIWIPPGVTTLRGVIVHQHGCGEGSCKSGLTGAFDLHWQALARKHDCALLAPAYEQPQTGECQKWCDPRKGSDAAFHQALADLGKQSGHPELVVVPWALWGHSGGGTWAGAMTLLHPQRVTAAWLRSGVPPVKTARYPDVGNALPVSPAARQVPLMCNLGTAEGVTIKDNRFARVWPVNEAFFGELRAKGALIGVAIDPRTSHECGNQRYLAIPWFDACLTARLPKRAGDALASMPAASAWLADLSTKEAVPATKFGGDPDKAIWLPNEAVARAWMSYVRDAEVEDKTPPPAPKNLRLKDNLLTWEAEADLESGLAGFIIERDGRIVARLPEKPANRFGRPVFQGLQYSDTPAQPLVTMTFTDSTAEPGRRHVYRVIAVNSVGLESGHSRPIAD